MDETDRPVTHQELRQELAGVEERLRGSQAEMEERLIERMRDMQTEIIRVFMATRGVTAL